VGASVSERESILVDATQVATDFRRDIDSIEALGLDGEAAESLASVRPLLEEYVQAGLRYLAHVTARENDSPEELAAFQRKFDAAAQAQDNSEGHRVDREDAWPGKCRPTRHDSFCGGLSPGRRCSRSHSQAVRQSLAEPPGCRPRGRRRSQGASACGSGRRNCVVLRVNERRTG
jgi:hypothetical protein